MKGKQYSFLNTPLLHRIKIDIPGKLLVRSGWVVLADQSVADVLKAVDESPLNSVFILDNESRQVIGAATASEAVFAKCKGKKPKPCERECAARLADCPEDQRITILAPDGCHCFCGANGPEVPVSAAEMLYP